ncbi:MAG: aminoacyl-tRNA hydrolase [Lachnospiraceae bacterium]|nr:aminoacyl-tRNA hydrolase [Lachnospiraceae bacterium]
MYIIVGLGNPGPEYAGTRHNVGFETVGILADRYGIATDYIRHKAVCGKGVIDREQVMLAMPQTYMNLSGESVRQLASFYKIDIPSELIIICDDVNLPPGRLRIRKSGSAGGHNGLKSIISCLGTDEFMRIRVGVGDKQGGRDLADHVLGHFSDSEQQIMDVAFRGAADAAVTIMKDGADAAMNRFNMAKKEADESD